MRQWMLAPQVQLAAQYIGQMAPPLLHPPRSVTMPTHASMDVGTPGPACCSIHWTDGTAIAAPTSLCDDAHACVNGCGHLPSWPSLVLIIHQQGSHVVLGHLKLQKAAAKERVSDDGAGIAACSEGRICCKLRSNQGDACAVCWACTQANTCQEWSAVSLSYTSREPTSFCAICTCQAQNSKYSAMSGVTYKPVHVESGLSCPYQTHQQVTHVILCHLHIQHKGHQTQCTVRPTAALTGDSMQVGTTQLNTSRVPW
jgi:hypothetical protein